MMYYFNLSYVHYSIFPLYLSTVPDIGSNLVSPFWIIKDLEPSSRVNYLGTAESAVRIKIFKDKSE